MVRLIILLLALAAASGAGAQAPTVAPGDGFEVERYSVVLRPDLAGGLLSGRETIVVRATAAGVTQLAFSPNALRISEATIDGHPVAVASGPEAIRFTLPRALRRGRKAALQFRIDGTPARGLTATPAGIYTSYFACDWMVCLQDSPGDKAHLALDLVLPAGARSVGVGRALEVKAMGGDLALHRWRTVRPYSAYLFAFAAGALRQHSVAAAGGELVYHDATGGQADLAALFARTPAMAAFFSEKSGVPLPHGRYGQVLVPGREAQETVSFSLIGQGELDQERADPGSAWIIAHELAHQWWGNLVTCATWRDFWLNEGLATFMVAAFEEHHSGEAAYSQRLEAARRRVERVAEIGIDKPLAWDGKYPSLGARRAVQYSKGALFLAHLRETMGDAAFWEGLRRYTRRHAGGVVTSEDFQRAMQASSRHDLAPHFAEWVYGS